MYRVRSYPFVFIENRVGKMVVIIASVMMQPYLAVSWRRWQISLHGYRRVWALLRRQSEATEQPVVNAKRVYRVMREHGLLLKRKPAAPLAQQAHKGRVAVKESNRRWCSDGFEFRCDNGENYESRSPWIAAIGEALTGRPVLGVTIVTLCKMSC